MKWLEMLEIVELISSVLGILKRRFAFQFWSLLFIFSRIKLKSLVL